MSSLPIAPLDGERGYLRWKESVLLRLRTLGLAAHVLSDSEENRPGGGATEHWAHDDALCRGHILVTLSDRLIPVYAHHDTAGALWRAVARTYDEPNVTGVSLKKALAFRYKEGQPLREQLALLQACATVGKLSDRDVCDIVEEAGFPEWMAMKVARHRATLRMDDIWNIAEMQVMMDRGRQDRQTTDGQTSSASASDFRPQKRGRRR